MGRPCPTRGGTGMSRTEIETSVTDFVKAFNNHDAAGLGEFYTEDARMLPPDAPLIVGRAGIEAMVKEMFAAGCQSLDLEPIDVHESCDMAVDVGRYTLTIQPPGAELVQEVGKYVAVYRRQPDGGMKLIVDTFNRDQP